MYRAMAAYVLMLVLAGAALCAILALGSRLTAPNDLAGVWVIAPSAPGAESTLRGSFLFKQSGRFAMLYLDDREPVALTLHGRTAGDNATLARLYFEGQAATLTATGAPGGDDYEFQLTGPIAALFRAHRTWRTYPPAPTASATQP